MLYEALSGSMSLLTEEQLTTFEVQMKPWERRIYFLKEVQNPAEELRSMAIPNAPYQGVPGLVASPPQSTAQAGAWGGWKTISWLSFAKNWKLPRIGKVEAGILGLFALGVLAALMPNGLFSQTWEYVPPAWRSATFGVLATVLARLAYRPLLWVHRQGGVVQRDGGIIYPDRKLYADGRNMKGIADDSVFESAAWIAWSSFVSVPFIVLGLLLGSGWLLLIPIGITAGAWTHGELNQKIEDDTLREFKRKVVAVAMTLIMPMLGFLPGVGGDTAGGGETQRYLAAAA
jgi:hypothetical protein